VKRNPSSAGSWKTDGFCGTTCCSTHPTHFTAIDAGIVNELCVHVESGKVRPLAFQSEKKFELMPDVPTFWDLGYQIETPIWFGLHTPAGVPPLVVKKLHDAFKKAYDDPSFKKLLLTLHMMPYYKNTLGKSQTASEN